MQVLSAWSKKREMGVFPRFGRLINQNIQPPSKAESKKSENLESKSVSEGYPEDVEETKKQLKLWRVAEKKNPWYDYPPKVEVEREKGLCHLTIQFTIGLPPEAVFDIFTSHDKHSYSYYSIMKRRNIWVNRSKRVINDNGPEEKLVEVKKDATWKFLGMSGSIPIHLTFNERRKDFSAIYITAEENVMFMKTFEGKWQIEPWYVHNDRFCKPRLPKNREEYRKCTGGKGLIASRVTLLQTFEPRFPLNLPPVSWYMRRITIKTTKTLVEDLQIRGAVIRSV